MTSSVKSEVTFLLRDELAVRAEHAHEPEEAEVDEHEEGTVQDGDGEEDAAQRQLLPLRLDEPQRT